MWLMNAQIPSRHSFSATLILLFYFCLLLHLISIPLWPACVRTGYTPQPATTTRRALQHDRAKWKRLIKSERNTNNQTKCILLGDKNQWSHWNPIETYCMHYEASTKTQTPSTFKWRFSQQQQQQEEPRLEFGVGVGVGLGFAWSLISRLVHWCGWCRCRWVN